MKSKSFVAPAIRCGHCVKTIERELGELDGVRSIEANEKNRRVTVQWDEPPANWESIRTTLAEIGYPPQE